MTPETDPTRVVRSWLADGVTELPDRVLDAVLDQLPATPQRRATPWPVRRLTSMNAAMRFAVAAALVVAVGIGAYVMAGGAPPVGGPEGSPTPSPTATPRPRLTPTPEPTPLPEPTLLPQDGRLVEGTYILTDPFDLQISVPLPDGWRVWGAQSPDGAALYTESPDPPAGRGLVIGRVTNLYADPCDANAGFVDPPEGIRELAEALAAQPRTEAGEITDVTIAGYSGVEVTYRATIATDECPGTIHRWIWTQGPRQALVAENDRVWILDVDGNRLVIDMFWFDSATDEELAEIVDIVEAIEIEAP